MSDDVVRGAWCVVRGEAVRTLAMVVLASALASCHGDLPYEYASLELSTSSLTFTVNFGGPNPPLQQFTISNPGPLPLNWTGTPDQPWVSLSPGSGSVLLDGSQVVDVTVDITGLIAGTYTSTVDLAAPGALNAPQSLTVNLLVTQPGVTVTESGGSTDVTEGGATDTYTVVLTSIPTADVTITVSPDAEVNVDQTTLTFTPGNWNIAQTIIVSAVDDAVPEGAHTGTITHSATSLDTTYDAISIASVIAAIADNDTPGITVVPTSGLITDEAGTTATFTVVLDTQPSDPVTIDVSSDDTGEGTVSTATLTFNAGNWDTAQTVTVTGVDDAIVDGDQPYSIVLDPAVSADGNYSGMDPTDVSVTNQDDDTLLGIIFVDQGAGGANNGTSWLDAFTDLQSALLVAASGDEIWVAAATYDPGGAARTDTFQLVAGAAVYGGFNGTEALRNDRLPGTNVTILSGDFNGDDVVFTNNAENAFHVVTGDDGATLDGFTIRGGNADGGGADDDGAGMVIAAGFGPTTMLNDVIFTENAANGNGGGLYLESAITVSSCTFTNNMAIQDAGAVALVNTTGALLVPFLTACTFTGNQSARGGAMTIDGANMAAVVDQCTFDGNSTFPGSNGNGGAIDMDGVGGGANFVNIVDSVFTNNTADRRGGAVHTTNGSQVYMLRDEIRANSGAQIEVELGIHYLVNCLIADATTNGHGVRFRGVSLRAPKIGLYNCTVVNNPGRGVQRSNPGATTDATVVNSIVWLNGTQLQQVAASSVFNSNIQGFTGGTNNINTSPDFVDPTNATVLLRDYHLNSVTPTVDGGDQTLIPALFIGAATFDLDGLTRIVDGDGVGGAEIDMGCYERP